MKWTDEKIAALASNDSTERRGRMLANSAKWNYVATNYEVIWGECKGSGSQPYLVQVNLKGPHFKCNCPVRQLPCKHILGIFFLFAKSSALFKFQAPPEWVSNWVDKQAAPITSSGKPTPNLIKSDEELEKARLAKEKRWQKRLELMASGIDELELWLSDVVRQGIANTDALKPRFWNQVASKMVDAKLPRLSNYLKETYQLILKEQDWTELVVSRLGELYFWVESFKRRENLSPNLQDELYRSLGRTDKKADIIANNPNTKDNWFVLGKQEGVDIEGRNFRKVWLQGIKTGEHALILDYSFGNMGYEEQYTIGDLLAGKLCYYSSNYKQRAVFESFEQAPIHATSNFQSYETLSDFLLAYSEASAQHPWLTSFPAVLSDLSAFMNDKNELQLVDKTGHLVPVHLLDEQMSWKILAMSGGQSICIFGEWDGLFFEPLSLLDVFDVIAF